MGESFKRNNNVVFVDDSKNLCVCCLSDSHEMQLQDYSLICAPLKDIFQVQSLLLCCYCKRMAQHAEKFIQNVQSNQFLLENSCNVMDETLKSVQVQTQPLVNLKHVSFETIELSKRVDDSEESFVVCCRKTGVEVKVEMKEEEFLDNLEAEFINGDDEFPEMYVKEEDEFPLNTLLKKELVIETVEAEELININSAVKKKIKKKQKIKKEDDKKSKRDATLDYKLKIPKIKRIYITKKQCLEERVRLAQNPVYLGCAFKCTDCLKGFSFKGSYDKHMEKHNQCMGEFECDVCKQRMDSEEKLVSHMKYHFIRYKCPECGIIRNCRTTIKDHYSAYHLGSENLHICEQCMKSFKRHVSLRKHVRYAHGAKERVQCAYCNKTYANKTVLRSHMMLKHSKEVSAVEVCKKCVCPECGMGFKSPSQLRNHSIKHSDSRDYYCVECDKSFKSQSILKTHLKTASIHVNYKELPLACLHCDKRFANRRDVERHTNRVHLNVKPYSCDMCDKAYVSSWQLKEHKRNIHEGYKRPLQYPCPMCDKVFDRNAILKSHIRTHTGERPYQCNKCPAKFSQASVLRTHDRLIHLKLTRDGRPKVDIRC